MLVEWVFVALVHFGGPPHEVMLMVAHESFSTYPDCMVFGAGAKKALEAEMAPATVAGTCLETKRISF